MHKSGIIKTFAIAFSLVMITGCKDTSERELVTVSNSPYTKIEYETVTAQKGDMQPEFEIALVQGAMTYYNYTIEGEKLELENISVSVGDYVKAGQELVSFKNEELEKKVSKLEEEVEQNRLLLEHVKRQRAIDVDESNTTDEKNKALKESYDNKIKLLEDDISLSEIYLSEERRELEKCRVTAKDDGTITFISNALINGIVVSGSQIITETSGDVNFSAEVTEDYEFNVGDVFTAVSPKMECEVMVTKVEQNGQRSVSVYFAPVSADVVNVSGEKFVITIKKENLSNVVYVDQNTLYKDKNQNYYVYVVSEDGYREVKFVEVETITNGMAIIADGLEGGEEVALK